MPCPTVTAVNGHCIAGGFILSLASDLRIVKSGKLKLGLSEVDLGVCVPAGPQILLAARTSESHALRVGMLGHLFGGEEANPAGRQDDIEYVTIATTGNVTDFGNLVVARYSCSGCSDGTYGLTGGNLMRDGATFSESFSAK